ASSVSFSQDAAFHHRGGMSADERHVGFFSAWNPTGTKALLEPGVKVVFFGSAPACDKQVAAGPVSHTGHYSLEELAQNTGLPVEPSLGTELVMPTPDAEHCKSGMQSQRDGSFVIQGSSGIGLYTTVGPDTSGRRPLIDVFDAKGQTGSGANVGI